MSEITIREDLGRMAPNLFDGLRDGSTGWAQVAHDYTTLLTGDFDAKYPGWAEDVEFMDKLREYFAGTHVDPLQESEDHRG